MPEAEAITDARHSTAAILGLTEDPYAPDPSLRFFFESALLSQQVAIIKRLVACGSKMILVTGDRGSGKSTLVRWLIANTPDQWHQGRLTVTAPGNPPIRLKSNLNQRLVFFTKQHTLPSILFDDAHQLTQADLKLLIKKLFSNGRPNQFSTVLLFAEPGLRHRLNDAALALPPETVIEKIHLSPFTERQTGDYLLHRIRTAGVLDRMPFSRKQVRTIHRQSGGLPGCINGEAYVLLKKIKNCSGGIPPQLLNLRFNFLPATVKNAG